MTAKLIDGRKVAQRINDQTRQELTALDFKPGLGVVLVGENPASKLYVGLKEKACRRLGLNFMCYALPTEATPEQILSALHELNIDDRVQGIIVQLPLPQHLDTNRIIAAIDPNKDADGFHPDNQPVGPVPAVLPAAVMELLRETGENLSGLQAIVIAKGDVLFSSLSRPLQRIGITTQLIKPTDLSLTNQADILIVAVGQPKLIRSEQVKPGAIVIDIGTNKIADRTVGDVDADSVKKVAHWLTPVPGGVGPVTVAQLLLNVVRLAKIKTF
ncbi:bifunctional 5,10-methylenetetrahydrofolate dehydrogenase/5,10-methenyltetrahydrofolate cyclohydrolase [Patescibacteria group bacterium]|nr:bifunctional 5,10-methylenetetrahydrofolate dehydrogenase/5,10-methenyltetrahydrofolate cyclohydrolase [Patescibacteria group bacterium]MBU1029004.1 bifunctional 5,10-methylenetetrahydrofolate dehydrogenase/5,10-methenyltetrahydrofolate cyclohydrolase [Patescibacteria group bacterium]